ncbi:mitochondrial chaperone BCS1 [Coprinopsis cinerea AmutBmut pab1-1]|nr:mitochondrial chaperone BCS1 [Coprinopsis cinerea AmutBmut pab1-1]
MPDWIKFQTAPLALGFLTSAISVFWDYALRHFYLEAVIYDRDPSFTWMVTWITNHPAWSSTQSSFEISTSHSGVDDGPKPMPFPGDEELPEKPTDQGSLYLLPKPGSWYRIRHGSSVISFFIEAGSNDSFRVAKTLRLRIYSFNAKSLLRKIATEAKATYRSTVGKVPEVWFYRPGGFDPRWEVTSHKPRRAIDTVILEPGRSEAIVSDVKDFVSSGDWYRARGIPFRRGYLLHGPPGTGKTSIVGAIAGELGLDVYCLALSARDLDDEKLSKLVNRVPPQSILLIEDIDAAVSPAPRQHGARNENPHVNSPPGPMGPDSAPVMGPGQVDNSEAPRTGVTLAGLLNALDGVDSAEGRILFATTNYPDRLDSAIKRPGRMDRHFYIGLTTRPQAKELFKKFYPTFPKGSRSEFVASGSLDSIAEADDVNERLELETLATTFANIVPENTYAMAALQGYLLTYKSDPYGACNSDNFKQFMDELSTDLKAKGDDEQTGDTAGSRVSGAAPRSPPANLNLSLPDAEPTDRLVQVPWWNHALTSPWVTPPSSEPPVIPSPGSPVPYQCFSPSSMLSTSAPTSVAPGPSTGLRAFEDFEAEYEEMRSAVARMAVHIWDVDRGVSALARRLASASGDSEESLLLRSASRQPCRHPDVDDAMRNLLSKSVGDGESPRSREGGPVTQVVPATESTSRRSLDSDRLSYLDGLASLFGEGAQPE